MPHDLIWWFAWSALLLPFEIAVIAALLRHRPLLRWLSANTVPLLIGCLGAICSFAATMPFWRFPTEGDESVIAHFLLYPDLITTIDEVFLINGIESGANPPFYWLIVWCLMGTDANLFELRAITTLISALGAIPFVLCARAAGVERTGQIVAGFLFAIFPASILYHSILRPMAFLQGLAALTLLVTLRSLQNGGKFGPGTALTLHCLAWTHYAAWPLILVSFGSILLKKVRNVTNKTLSIWEMLSVISIILSISYLVFCILRFPEARQSWTPPWSWSRLAEAQLLFFGSGLRSSIPLVGILLVSWFAQLWAFRKATLPEKNLLIGTIVPLLLMTGLFFIGGTFVRARYFMPLLPGALLLALLGSYKLHRTLGPVALLALCLVDTIGTYDALNRRVKILDRHGEDFGVEVLNHIRTLPLETHVAHFASAHKMLLLSNEKLHYDQFDKRHGDRYSTYRFQGRTWHEAPLLRSQDFIDLCSEAPLVVLETHIYRDTTALPEQFERETLLRTSLYHLWRVRNCPPTKEVDESSQP